MADGMLETIQALFEYGEWANERLLEKARGLSPADLGRRLTQGADPVLPTFGHLVGADLRWLARWRGDTPLPVVSPADFPDLATVESRWRPIWDDRRRYLAGLDAAALREPIRFTRPSGEAWLPRWQGMVQAANHGTQHRSELAAMLTDLGHSPGDLDFSRFCLRHAP